MLISYNRPVKNGSAELNHGGIECNTKATQHTSSSWAYKGILFSISDYIQKVAVKKKNKNNFL